MHCSYYKQSLNPNRALVLADKNRKYLGLYRALGWTGSTGPAAVTKARYCHVSRVMLAHVFHFARDLSFMRRVQNKHGLKLGMKTNHQKHFKDRNGMCM